MKASDLQIGDWFEVDDSSISTYRHPHFQIVTAQKLVDIEHRRLIVKPIPITPEILELNGYKHDKMAERYMVETEKKEDACVMYSDDNRIIINNNQDLINSCNEWFVHIDTVDFRTMATLEITYVHELQHALKLCDIETNIIV